MATILLLNTINGSPQQQVTVGAIIEPKLTSFAIRILEKTSEKLIANGLSREYRIVVETNASVGCKNDALESGDGGWLVAELYYNHGVTTFFGPICDDAIELISRVVAVWDAVQFNFWRDYYQDVELPSIVQMSPSGATNVAFNIAATLSALKWNKVHTSR